MSWCTLSLLETFGGNSSLTCHMIDPTLIIKDIRHRAQRGIFSYAIEMPHESNKVPSVKQLVFEDGQPFLLTGFRTIHMYESAVQIKQFNPIQMLVILKSFNSILRLD
jgi:hypothetical protein